MNIQFFRLSLTLVLALLSYSWILSAIWDSYAPTKHIITVEQVFELHFNQELEISKSLPVEELQLPQSLLTKIKSGDLVPLTDNQNNVYYYRFDNGQVQIIGPVKIDSSTIDNQTYLTSLYFVGVIIILLFWFRPLFLELSLLSEKALTFSQTASWQPFSIRKSSPIFPVVKVFNQMGQRIEELIEQYKGISRMIGHEIRTPLARTQFSLATIDTDEHREELISIQEDIDEIAAITEEFLNIAKLEYTQARLPVHLIEIKPMVNELVAKFQRTTRHQININIIEGLAVSMDEVSFKRMLQNLIGNGLKHCNSLVQITIRETDKNYLLEVSDDGSGFVQADKALKTYYQEYTTKDGFGLGFSIIRMIAKWYQGQIEIGTCNKLNGAKVTFTWPKL